jgi:hypothetical protein
MLIFLNPLLRPRILNFPSIPSISALRASNRGPIFPKFAVFLARIATGLTFRHQAGLPFHINIVIPTQINFSLVFQFYPHTTHGFETVIFSTRTEAEAASSRAARKGLVIVCNLWCMCFNRSIFLPNLRTYTAVIKMGATAADISNNSEMCGVLPICEASEIITVKKNVDNPKIQQAAPNFNIRLVYTPRISLRRLTLRSSVTSLCSI